MKRKAFTFTLIIATVILTFFAAFNIKNVNAEGAYTIEKVNHTIEVMYNGYIFLNDTVQITGTTPSFLIGLPYEYGPHVLRCVAYSSTAIFPVSLGVSLDNHIGFYGARIDFPKETPQVFTVGFVLSNNLLMQDPINMSQYTLDFPEYPVLTEDAANCNVSILLPEGSTYLGGTVDTLTYRSETLSAFTRSRANVSFSSIGNAIQMAEIEELKQKITIGGTGEIEGSDTYRMINKSPQKVSSIEIILPGNTTNTSAYDQLGRRLVVVNVTGKTNRYKVSFTTPLGAEASTVFTVEYCLPGEVFVEQKEPESFDLTFPLFQHLDYYIEHTFVTFVLPEGAKILSFENTSAISDYRVTKNVFQETLTIERQGVFSLDNSSIGITYKYNLLWVSFRPTLWMWALVTVGCAMVVVWKRPKAPAPVTVPEVAMGVRSKDIKSFVDMYEQKRKIVLEMQSLKVRVSKGKVSRRRYKVRRRTLETRLNVLSRNLGDLKEKLRAAGGRYSDLMRRLEVVETEISEVEANIGSIEARHRRGELSLGAYRKLLGDYEQRKEKAETTVNEILIRLREEIQ